MKLKKFNRIMPQALYSMVLSLVAFAVLTSCGTQKQVSTPARNYSEIEGPQPTLFDEAATAWAHDHTGALVSKYIETAGNKLDPDEIRKLFCPIGYDGGTNTLKYRAAEKVLVDTIYKAMMQRAVSQGNRSVVIFTGPSASGKSTATKTMDFSKVGVVYDGALNKYSSLAGAIDKAKAAGMKDITVVAVYNTIRNCFRNSINRGTTTNRFIHVPYMIESFQSNQGKMAKIMENYPDVKIVAIDKRDNVNANIIPAEECKKWDFNVTQEDKKVLFGYIMDEIDKGNLQPHQLAAISGDITTVPDLNEENMVLAADIDRRIRLLRAGLPNVEMILDADFGSSTDDLFALMMLHHYIDEGIVDLKGIIVDREGQKNAELVDVFNTFYGHPNIPIGLERNGVKNPRCFIPYSGIVDLKDNSGNPLFKRTQDASKCPDGYKLYRKLLSKAKDKSIVIVAIGFATTLAQLFESGADEYSSLSGVDLFEKKVKAVYMQSGRFEAGDSLCGYNMRAASHQSAIFYDKLPRSVELIMSPSNVGDAMNYAPEDVMVDLATEQTNPIKSVYVNYTCDTGQRMWDTNCLEQAVKGDDAYVMSTRGTVKFVDKGEESLLLFKPDRRGNARYQMPFDSYIAQQKIMDIRAHNRMPGNRAKHSVEAPQRQSRGEEALDWAMRRKELLVDKYVATAAGKINTEAIRMLFRPIGYNGYNPNDYTEAIEFITKAIKERLGKK